MNIDQQINEELETFKNKVYDGKVEIPKNILELFRTGILFLAPQTHGILASKLKALYITPVKKLTNGMLSDIIRLVVCTPFGKIYEGVEFEVALESHIKLEKFILGYNLHVDEFQNKLKMKKATLQSLSQGVRGNGMRIIPQA